jgi:hypothetical protein
VAFCKIRGTLLISARPLFFSVFDFFSCIQVALRI